MKIGQALKWGENYLAQFSFEDPAVEAEAILEGIIEIPRTSLYLNREEQCSPDEETRFQELIKRRSQREPAAYLLGVKNFNGLDLKVNRSVLIPRPETELLVEEALGILRNEKSKEVRVLEIGTGSGCISIYLALSFNPAQMLATDISEEALVLAKDNAHNFKVSKNIQFMRSHIYDSLPTGAKGDFDMIISNPPYIASSQFPNLDLDLAFEPRTALDGGEQGLDVIKPLVKNAPAYLRTNGTLIIEIGYDQGPRVKTLFEEAGFSNIRIVPDLNHHDRIVLGKINGPI